MLATSRRHQVLRPLVVLMSVAFVVSVVHYIDNTVNYADFPQAEPGSRLPNPSVQLVAGGWFFFTAFGVLGLWLFVRGRITAAAIAIAVYSGSGLVGFGHYAVPDATDMVWWRQTHVIIDITCGIAILGFALWAAIKLPHRPKDAAPRVPA